MAQSAFKGAISAGVSRPATAAAQASTAGGGSGDVDLKRSVTIYGTVAYPSVAEVSPLDGKYQVAVIADPADRFSTRFGAPGGDRDLPRAPSTRDRGRGLRGPVGRRLPGAAPSTHARL